jgi:hypothetical protein
MTPLHRLDRRAVAALGRDLSRFLCETLTDCSERIARTQARIAQIDRQKPRDAVKERTAALAPTRQRLTESQSRYDAQKGKGHGLGWVLSPLDTHKALNALETAKSEHQNAVLAYDEPVTKALRDNQIAAHNQRMAEEREEQDELKVKLQKFNQVHLALSSFVDSAAQALTAASGRGWLAADFGKILLEIDACIREGGVSSASAKLAQLVFQRRPQDAVYARLQNQALDIRKQAYAKHHGVAVTGSFPPIVEASARLAAANMKEACADQLLSGLHSADQWQFLSVLAASPENLSTDVLWSLYWAMFQCQQEMADYLAGTVSMEDPLNGRFSYAVERWLSDWASRHIPLFGYPVSQSYLGTLNLAGTPEESRLGADLGVIIALNIGGLVCRKAVILQAKRAKDWEANLGSQKAQLPKLSKLPRGGYYLFYHESPQLRFDSPVPTVSGAQALQQLILDSNRKPDATSLQLDVRTSGWDWASFFSFGLCDAGSDIGEPFDTVDDAMRILGSGETGALPLRLFVVAIEDQPFVMEMTRRLREQYRPAEKQPDMSAQKNRKKKDLGKDSSEMTL